MSLAVLDIPTDRCFHCGTNTQFGQWCTHGGSIKVYLCDDKCLPKATTVLDFLQRKSETVNELLENRMQIQDLKQDLSDVSRLLQLTRCEKCARLFLASASCFTCTPKK